MRHEADIRLSGGALGADPNTVPVSVNASNAARQVARIRSRNAKAEENISLAIRGQRRIDVDRTVVTQAVISGVVVRYTVERNVSHGGRARVIGIIKVIE